MNCKRVTRAATRRVRRLSGSCRDAWDHVFEGPLLRTRPIDEFLEGLGLSTFVWGCYASDCGAEVGLPLEADRDVLFSLIASVCLRRFLEIGTWMGGTAAVVKPVCPGAEVLTVNHPQPDQVNNPPHRDEIGVAFRRRKLEVKQVWADSARIPESDLGDFHVIFTDGDHRYSAVRRDLENSRALLSAGGYLLFQDCAERGASPYPQHTLEVVRAVRSSYKRHRHEIAAGLQVEGSWIGIIVDNGARDDPLRTPVRV